MAERRPVPLRATDLVGPFPPMPLETTDKRAPRVRKPSCSDDVIFAPSDDLEGHQAALRQAFGETLSDQFVQAMMGKLISCLRPHHFDTLEEATLNAAIAVIASIKALRT